MKKLPDFPQKHAGEKTTLDWATTDMVWACCECSLVHRWRFVVDGKRLTIQAWDAPGALTRHSRKLTLESLPSAKSVINRAKKTI